MAPQTLFFNLRQRWYWNLFLLARFFEKPVEVDVQNVSEVCEKKETARFLSEISWYISYKFFKWYQLD